MMTRIKRWKIILLLAAHVLLGIVIGSVVTLNLAKKEAHKFSNPQKSAEKMLGDATKNLKLAPGQVSEVTPQFREIAINARELQKDYLIKISAMAFAAEEKMMLSLNPEQRKLVLLNRENREKKIQEWMKPGEKKQ